MTEPRSVERIPIDGGPTESIYSGGELSIPAVARDGTLFLMRATASHFRGLFGAGIHEFVRISPPDGVCQRLDQIAGEQLPAKIGAVVISPDGRYLATARIDGGTANLWVVPTEGGQMRPVTDFGDRSVLIVRSVSWAANSQFLYAAVADIRTDIVLLDGLLG